MLDDKGLAVVAVPFHPKGAGWYVLKALCTASSSSTPNGEIHFCTQRDRHVEPERDEQTDGLRAELTPGKTLLKVVSALTIKCYFKLQQEYLE